MIGAMVQLMGLPFSRAEQVVKRRLGRYPDLLPKNLESLAAGYDYALQQFTQRPPSYLVPPEGETEDRLVMTGNQAIAVGALAAGCRFYAGYPITPATDLMEFLAAELPKAGGALVQAEDEIAAINMIIGASFAGLPSMTATSGPGLSLMVEALGLADMTEVPIVVVDVQRAGPSTGMPTKTAQGDLYLAFYAGNDEAPRFVITPTPLRTASIRRSTRSTWLTLDLGYDLQAGQSLARRRGVALRRAQRSDHDPAEERRGGELVLALQDRKVAVTSAPTRPTGRDTA